MQDLTPASWRLLIDPDGDGATNMATDEALLDAYLGPQGQDAPPTLRLYGWNPATLSLGKGQAALGSHDPAFLAAQGLGLVRRPTGGQAVLHERERTYCVVGRLDRPPFDAGVLATYEAISEALRNAIESLGVETSTAPQRPAAVPDRGPVCFNVASSHEVLHRGRKLVGSAQMRRRQAFLQHGSIPLRADAQRLGSAIGSQADASRIAGLSDALGCDPSIAELDAALIAGFERRFGIELVSGRRTAWERQRIEGLRCWKYLSACWTHRRRIGDIERSLAPPGLFRHSVVGAR
jgi:lipoate-protein ligase A